MSHVVLGAHSVCRQTTDPICTSADVIHMGVREASGSVAADAARIAGSLRVLESRWGSKVQVREGAGLSQRESIHFG